MCLCCNTITEPLLPLDEDSVKLATVCCCIFYTNIVIIVNNFEISLIQYKYLSFWRKEPDKDYIYAKDLFKAMNLECPKIFQLLFAINDDKLDYGIFFRFFCGICFCKFERLIKVFLSVCGIHSNVGSNKEHVILFFDAISPSSLANADVTSFLNKFNDDDMICIKTVTCFILSNMELYNTFWGLKKSLINNFFTNKNYTKIIKRINYYDLVAERKHRSVYKPKEKTLSKLYRILIEKEPPPFYSDYRTLGSCADGLHKYLIYKTRLMYGYSRRVTASKISINASDDFSHESNNEINLSSKHLLKTPIQSPHVLKLTLKKRSTHSCKISPVYNTSE